MGSNFFSWKRVFLQLFKDAEGAESLAQPVLLRTQSCWGSSSDLLVGSIQFLDLGQVTYSPWTSHLPLHTAQGMPSTHWFSRAQPEDIDSARLVWHVSSAVSPSATSAQVLVLHAPVLPWWGIMPPHIPLSPHLRQRPGAVRIFQRQQRSNPGKYPCEGKSMSAQCDSASRH